MQKRNACCSFCRKGYGDVGPLVEGPGGVYICGECVELCQSIVEQEKLRRRRAEAGVSPAPTIESFREKLDRLVPGQGEAKAALVAAAFHRAEGSYRYPQSPVLLVGPTRSGKLLLARALAYTFEVPFAEGDLQSLQRTGNEPAVPLLYQLLRAADFDLEVAQRGVVYVDGADQRATQERLLQLWDGPVAEFVDSRLTVDVTRILFVCGAEFAELDEAVTGTGRHRGQPVTGEALAALGMLPPFFARLRAVAPVTPTDEPTLARIVACVDFGRMAGNP